MSFWRKLNKVIFAISLVVFCLGVVVGCIFGFIAEWWIGLLVLGGGLILIPIMFSTWGILLEFLDNVAAIRSAVCSGAVPAPVNGSAPGQMQHGAASQPAVNQSANNAYYAPQMPDKWVCSVCGKKNDNDSAFCYNCGKPKA